MKIKLTLTLLTLFVVNSFANVTLPAVFGSNMVLQQKSKVKIWGWAKSGETVKITNNWNDQTAEYKTTPMGTWEIELQTPVFGGPYELIISGYNTIKLENILIGEVWLVSGQSNMEWSAGSGIDSAQTEIEKANFPEIRFFSVSHATAAFPQQNLNGKWDVCTPASMKYFSAIGYFFAKKLHHDLSVPVGIINSSWGGTPAEAWTPESAIKADPTLFKDAIGLKEVPWGPVKTASIYNAMIAPMIGFKLKGFLWYQGEANVMNAANYDKLLNTMIASWRNAWQEELPFYFVQIAPYKYGQPEEGVALRNAQRLAETTPNTAMVCISDIGNIDDIHPKNKKDVGNRLANVALKNLYNIKLGTVQGPKLLTYETKKGNIVLYYDSPDLNCDEKCKDNFEVADLSGNFYKANIRIKSNTITLSSTKVNNPIFARFEWNNIAEASLKNSIGLPASAFITDNWWSLFDN